MTEIGKRLVHASELMASFDRVDAAYAKKPKLPFPNSYKIKARKYTIAGSLK